MNQYTSISQRFHAIAAAQPHSTAIIDSDFAECTYGELANMADGIRALFPVEAPRRVGILCGHGPQQIAAMMAVLDAGAAFVALEPAIPGEKIRRIFTESQVDFVLTGRANLPRVKDFRPVVLPADQVLKFGATDLPPVQGRPDAPAYVLYTAGRKGKRRGVVVTNANVLNYVDAFINEFKISTGDVMLQGSVCTFDTFVEEVFTSLLSGAAIAVLPESNRGDLRSIIDFAERTGVTTVCGFTSLIKATNAMQRVPSKLRLVIANGKPLTPGDIDWLRQRTMIYYSFGLTETTVRASWQRCDNILPPEGFDAYPIGQPIAGTRISLLNEDLEPVSPMTIGEICIAGQGISRGYANTDDDSSSFAAMPDGTPVYLTGHYGISDGSDIYLANAPESGTTIEGRDVKYSEVENAMRQDSDVEDSVVCSFTDSRGRSYLVAYFTAKYSQAAVSLAQLRRNIKTRLAWFKVPEFFVQMPSLPRKRNGKADRRFLPHILKDK